MALVLTGASVLVGCAGARLVDGAYVVRTKGYRVVPPPGWERIASDADLAWQQPAVQGGLMAHGTCDGKTATRALPTLARYLRFGLHDVTGLEESPVVRAGQPGVASRFTARLDGRTVAVQAVTLRGPRCVYDLVMVAAPDRLETVAPEFERFVASFGLLDRPGP